MDGDTEWNAFIGRQSEEHYYADGFLEAALELAEAVIEKGQLGKRDTLIMPILYNARHGVELSLKFALARLCIIGATAPPPPHHDLAALWAALLPGLTGDLALRELRVELEPFIISLAAVDEDGQQLRYARTRAGKPSLEDLALANIAVIRDSLKGLTSALDLLKYRVLDLVDEHATGTFTAACSRYDLFRIARRLPPRAAWREPAFDAARTELRAEFGLSSAAFGRALKVIEAHREMGGFIGVERPLAHLGDENALRAVDEWVRAQEPRPAVPKGGFIIRARDLDPAKVEADARRQAIADAAILELLPPVELADLQTVFYFGRHTRTFSERYEEILDAALREHADPDRSADALRHITGKRVFGEYLAVGAARLGRPGLADQIRGRL